MGFRGAPPRAESAVGGLLRAITNARSTCATEFGPASRCTRLANCSARPWTRPSLSRNRAWVTTIEELPNGNLLVGNCHAGPENPQIIEITRDKKVVWAFKDFTTFGNSLANTLIVDGEAAAKLRARLAK